MVKMTGKLAIRGGPLLNVGDCYKGPHEKWIMENNLGEQMETEKPREPEQKAPSAPPNNKMVKEGKTWKKSWK